MIRHAIVFIALFSIITAAFGTEKTTQFSAEEIQILKSFGPWTANPSKDPSNRFSGNLDAIKLGRILFFDQAISVNGKISCHSCHDPEYAFTDGRDRSLGIAILDRNAPSIANLSLNRWFGWDGRSDNLWAQSVHPILNEKEMGATATTLVKRLSQKPGFPEGYMRATARKLSSEMPSNVLINIAKFLAAFQETLVTPKTEFDVFLEALIEEKDTSNYPDAAKRGLKTFIGKGQCFVCHFGPNFTNQEFADNALSNFIDGTKVDGGRFTGLQKYQTEPFKRSGLYSDQVPENDIWFYAELTPRNWGEFRVPSLRNVANTAPYMHNGSLKTLKDVVDHYSNIDLERLHTDGENILKPLKLSDLETQDLIAFLETLSGNPTSKPVR